MPEPVTTFGTELRRLRWAANLRQDVFAARCGFSAGFISQVEHETRRPTTLLIERTIAALGLPDLVAAALRQLGREERFRWTGECCPRCGFGGAEETEP